jgi:hypothetical protein
MRPDAPPPGKPVIWGVMPELPVKEDCIGCWPNWLWFDGGGALRKE